MAKRSDTVNLEFVSVGRILAPWGTKGDLKVEIMTDFPQRFAPGRVVYLDREPLTIERGHPHKNYLIVKLATIDSREAAEKLRDRLLEIPQAELYPLPEGEYYRFELMGLEVCTVEGESLGEIADILVTGSNDVFVVRKDGNEVLIPAIDDVIKSVDIGKRRVVVELVSGLLETKIRI